MEIMEIMELMELIIGKRCRRGRIQRTLSICVFGLLYNSVTCSEVLMIINVADMIKGLNKSCRICLLMAAYQLQNHLWAHVLDRRTVEEDQSLLSISVSFLYVSGLLLVTPNLDYKAYWPLMRKQIHQFLTNTNTWFQSCGYQV